MNLVTEQTDDPNGAMLTRAFQDFDQAARVLQQSYVALTARLQEMDLELAQTNATLRKHLKETEDMRAYVTAIVESLDTGVLVTDCAGIVTRCNTAAELMLGIPRAGLEGRRGRDILEEANMDRREYPIVLANGMAVSMTQAELHDQNGRSIGTLQLFHDVTKVRQLEERLQRRNRLAAMGEMVGRIAHEIRNPLGSIELFASMLRQDLAQSPQLSRYAEHISVSVAAMDRLLANLLAYMKPEHSHAAWHDTRVVLQEAMTMAAHALSAAPIDVRLDVDPCAPRLWGDVAQIKQILLNLIINAAQAMPRGGLLTVTVQADRRRTVGRTPGVRMTVRDTGVGIDPEHCVRIFDPFFTTKDDGTGLGLAIVHALVEAHRGRIDVESVVGRGTTFIVLLPGPGDSADEVPRQGE